MAEKVDNEEVRVESEPTDCCLTVDDKDDDYDDDAKTTDAGGRFKLPEHIKVDFHAMMAPPADYGQVGIGRYLAKPLSAVFAKVFLYTRVTLYMIIVALLGNILAFVWGVIFAVVHVVVVWLVQPTFTIAFVVINVASTLFRTVLAEFLVPLFRAIGQCFSSIKGSFRMTGVAPRSVVVSDKEITDV